MYDKTKAYYIKIYEVSMFLSSSLKYVTILSLMTGLTIGYSVQAAYHPMSQVYQIAAQGTKKSLRILKKLTKFITKFIMFLKKI